MQAASGRLRIYRHGRDIIDYVQTETPEGMKWKSTQLTELDTYGIEMQASYRGRRILRHITVSYGWMSSSKAAADHITKYALDYMKHKAAVQCGIDIGKGLRRRSDGIVVLPQQYPGHRLCSLLAAGCPSQLEQGRILRLCRGYQPARYEILRFRGTDSAATLDNRRRRFDHLTLPRRAHRGAPSLVYRLSA